MNKMDIYNVRQIARLSGTRYHALSTYAKGALVVNKKELVKVRKVICDRHEETLKQLDMDILRAGK